MALERFRTEADRKAFVARLLARGYRPAPPPVPGVLRCLRTGEFRVYDYHRKGCRPILRVSFWLPNRGPSKPVPKALPFNNKRKLGNCTTPGHGAIPEKARGLCPSCHRRWLYWTNADFRKRRRLDSRQYKRAKAQARKAA